MDDDRHCVLADFGLSEMKSEVYRLSGVPRPRKQFTIWFPLTKLLTVSFPLVALKIHSSDHSLLDTDPHFEFLGRGSVPMANRDQSLSGSCRYSCICSWLPRFVYGATSNLLAISRISSDLFVFRSCLELGERSSLQSEAFSPSSW